MTKVYLLLRNNKQSGPHSLEELLKLGIKPLDLIWVEGKSHGWSYPSEVSALKPYVAASTETASQPAAEKKSEHQSTQQISNKAYMPPEVTASGSPELVPTRNVYVSMPSNVARREEPKKQAVENVIPEANDKLDTSKIIEEKAEALRKKIQSYVPENKPAVKTVEPVVTKYSSTIPEREEEYTSWIYNQKATKIKKVNEAQKKLAAVIVAVLLLLAMGYGISRYHNDDKKEVVLTASAETPDVNKVTPEPLITEPPTPSIQPITEENNISEKSADRSYSEPVEKIVKNSAPVDKPVVETHKASSVSVDSHKKVVPNKTPEKEAVVKTTVEAKPVEIKSPVKKENEPAAPPTKTKRTFNEKVDAFFSKLTHKKETPPIAETPPSTNTNTNTIPGTTERKAVHRDDKQVVASSTSASSVPSSNVEHVNLADFVQVTSNKPSETWMLGVHGLKVSLHNTGSETVKTAEVELRYYTEQNEVLDKKTVSFNNILPGKTVTLPAPDHRLADHADVRLVNAK